MYATNGSLLQDGQKKFVGRCNQADAAATKVTTKAVLTTLVSASPATATVHAVLLQLHTRMLLTHAVHVRLAYGSNIHGCNRPIGLTEELVTAFDLCLIT